MQFTTYFLALTSAAIVVSGYLIPRDVGTIKADISSLSTQVTALSQTIDAFPNSGGTVAQALAIHSSAQSTDSAIKKATTDTAAVSGVSEADGQDIVNAFKAIQPTIVSMANAIIAKKPAFDALPIDSVEPLVEQDLALLQGDTKTFEAALQKALPSDLGDQATPIIAAIDNAFSSAVAAYNN